MHKKYQHRNKHSIRLILSILANQNVYEKQILIFDYQITHIVFSMKKLGSCTLRYFKQPRSVVQLSAIKCLIYHSNDILNQPKYVFDQISVVRFIISDGAIKQAGSISVSVYNKPVMPASFEIQRYLWYQFIVMICKKPLFVFVPKTCFHKTILSDD